MFKSPLFLLLIIIIIILSIKINSSKCEKENSTDSEQILSESRHEHLPGSDGNNNAVNVNNNNDKKPSLMQRVGSMLMMIPLMMQVLSLPGAIASIKASLLKSLFIGKLALIIMIYNLIISFRPKSEVVVVNHQPKMPEHYDHYYSPYDGDDSGWFG